MFHRQQFLTILELYILSEVRDGTKRNKKAKNHGENTPNAKGNDQPGG
jgi:hypothetical protein